MILKVLLLFTVTVLAFWISAICGGGASLILIPILNILLPTSVVPFSLTIGTFANSASRIIVFRRQVSWKIFLWFVPFSIPAVLLGAWLIKFVNPLYLQLVVALFLLVNLPQLFKSKKKLKSDEKHYPPYVLAIVGFFAGLVSGITGAIGLLFNRFYLKYGLSKEEIIATRAANEIFLHFIKLVVYVVLGLYSEPALYLGLLIALAAVISSLSVKYILPYISEFVFRKLGYGAMIVSGIMLLAGTSVQIMNQDQISFSARQKGNGSEATVNWRKSSFVLEYALDDGLEIERPIQYEELPDNLKSEYDRLLPDYDEILLEKVFTYGKPESYEFYCYKNKILTKREYE